MKSLYRFRSTHALLDGFQELENQEFYFAKMEELNDPMEGYRQFFWNGDEVLWRNLFKHYLLCLYNSRLLMNFVNDEYIFSEKDINTYDSEDRFNDMRKKPFQELSERFFQVDIVNECIKFLGKSGSLIEAELAFFLSLIHIYGIPEVEYQVSKMLKVETSEPKQNTDDDLIHIIKLFETMKEQSDDEKSYNFKAFMQELRSTHQSRNLMNYNDSSITKNKKFFLYNNFVDYYVQAIKKLIYPEVYITCFMENYKNAASWGHYADSHKGVCLIFEVNEDDENLTLPITKSSKEDQIFYLEKLHKINYESGFVSIDFFSSIGMIPNPQIIRQWYTDPQGTMSIYARHLKNPKERDNWNKKHWQEFIPGHIFKLKAWSYEQEHRLIINNLIGTEYEEPSERKLKYDFNHLKGIIFGIRTTKQDKIKIINIVKKLCEQRSRTDFKFYQAETSLDSSQIEALPLKITLR